MGNLYLVIVDSTGIQSYIFGSNRLRENVGASYLVHMATSGWAMDEPDHFLPAGHNIDPTKSTNEKRLDDKKIEENADQMAELLYAGGGNTVLIFRREEDAREFGRRLSRRLIENAPGLDAVMVIQPFNWTDNLAVTMQAAMRDMARKKSERARSQPLLGLGVTAACASTGLVANYHEPEPGDMPTDQRARLSISAEVAAKWDNNDAAKARLKQELSLPSGFDYPDDFDHLGRSEGEQSYIGVVHADGNSMGVLLEGITSNFAKKSPPENRAYITELRKFSDDANQVGLKALQAVVASIAEWNRSGRARGDSQSIQPGQMALKPFHPSKRKDKGESPFISIRPIVFGGDDVTFVCDGRIALQAAKVFLDAFIEETIYGEPAIACAGVAIVKVHYPFARAYELAEALTKNAKGTYHRAVPAIDWHLAQSGLFGSLGQIRTAEYEYKPDPEEKTRYSLLMRPLVTADPDRIPEEVAEKQGKWRTWENFVEILQAFQQSPRNSVDGKWPRNKVMGLRVELVNSRWEPEHISLKQHIKQLGLPPQELKLPRIANGSDDYQETGWIGNRGVYFDAIESIEQMIEYPGREESTHGAEAKEATV